MNTLLVRFFCIIVFVYSAHSVLFAQGTLPDAAILAPAAAINEILGTHIAEGPSSLKGKYCSRKSPDGSEETVIQYTDFHDSKTAQSMLQMNFEGNQKDIAQNKLAVGIYETITLFPDAGANANVMTGTGTNAAWKNNVRFQFVLGSYLVSFDTRGTPMASVIEKLSAIYKMIKTNSGM